MRWPGFRKVRRQVCKRIDRRLRELGLADISAYQAYLEAHSSEWSVLDGLCRISISRFYRDRGVFDHLRDRVLPALASAALARGEHQLRCWSAGCASGEEAYTLQIIWRQCLAAQFPALPFHVVATDADARLLDRAAAGCYSASSLKDLPRQWLPAAFAQKGDLFHVAAGLRAGIDFRRQDIRRQMPPGPFHLVLCRSLVFTYFEESLQEEVLRGIVRRLAPGGALAIGKQERLPPAAVGLEAQRTGTCVYRKVNRAAGASGARSPSGGDWPG
jgi:chemotaxis protein methyltransferase CheR